MTRFLSSKPFPAMALVSIPLLIAVLWWSPYASAQEGGRGWTVEQGSSKEFYEWGKWEADATQTNLTLTNKADHVSVNYYGTFKVTKRERR